jgi:hypothetical protein
MDATRHTSDLEFGVKENGYTKHPFVSTANCAGCYHVFMILKTRSGTRHVEDVRFGSPSLLYPKDLHRVPRIVPR